MDSILNGLNPEGTQPRLGLNPEWTQPQLGLNTEWIQPRLGFNPECTELRMGLNLEFVSTSNGTISPTEYKNGTVFFGHESRCISNEWI
jgi:hypothetical protein